MTVEQVRDLILARVRALDVEHVGLLDALGRVLARDVTSDVDVPPFDSSTRDGYAVRAGEPATAGGDAPAELRVVERVAAGVVPARAVGPGEAARVMTGAPLPAGADAVVMMERATVLEGDGGEGSRVRLSHAASPGEHVRRRGAEIRAGDVALPAGGVIGPADVGRLASAGHVTVPVHSRPRVAVIATGTELVEADERPGPGKIRNSNAYAVAAQVVAAGGVPLRFPIVPDDPEATRAALERAACEADVIVTTGGVSAGDHDCVRPVLEEHGDLVGREAAMHPGSRQVVGFFRGVPCFGLPGNPAGAHLGFELFVRPALRRMQGHAAPERPRVEARPVQDLSRQGLDMEEGIPR